MTIAAKKMTYREFREMEFPDNDAFIIGTFLKKNSLFYKNIIANRYIVIMHPDFILKNHFADSEVYIVKYKSEEEIGKKLLSKSKVLLLEN